MNELNLDIEREEIPTAKCVSIDALRGHLQLMENARKEIVGAGIYDPAGANVNFVDWVQQNEIPTPLVEVFEVQDEEELRKKLGTHTAVQYAVMKINGAPKKVLIARKGASMMLRGKISTFGGKDDEGMKPGEPLAIIQNADIAANPKIAELFEGSTGPALGRRLLNKTTSYIACRWDYKTTSRKFLLQTEVLVRNPVTGVSIKARPVDWGPAEWTNRVADLSDFAAQQLGLKTNDVCEVIIPLPAGVNGPVLPKPIGDALRDAVVAVARGQYERYHGIHEANEPLSTRIKEYWNELRQLTGDNQFTFTNTDVAWSAVFVSWCLMQGGMKHADFGFSVAHSQFVFKAIQREQAGGVFPAFPITGCKPQPGDIIHNNRPGGNVTFAQAQQQPQYESHSAIVVDVGEDEDGLCALTVGGNESHGVGFHRLPLDRNTGLLVPRNNSPYISIIRLS